MDMSRYFDDWLLSSAIVLTNDGSLVIFHRLKYLFVTIDKSTKVWNQGIDEVSCLPCEQPLFTPPTYTPQILE
jgi:hypothetical protein